MIRKNIFKIRIFALFLLFFTSFCLLAGISVFADSELSNTRISGWQVQLRSNRGHSEVEWQKIEQSPKLPREYQGFIAYRGTFSAPKSGEPLAIYLGQVGDVDRVFINGHLIGQTGDFPPNYRPLSTPDISRTRVLEGRSV